MKERTVEGAVLAVDKASRVENTSIEETKTPR